MSALASRQECRSYGGVTAYRWSYGAGLPAGGGARMMKGGAAEAHGLRFQS